MILIKYIIKELCKNQLIVLAILFLVCICQKFVRMLHLVVYDNISWYLIFVCIGLNIPEVGKLIIPFSVFISVPITLYRLHMHNEILAMYVCGIDKYTVIKSVLFFASIILVFAGINMSWLSPCCGYYQNKLLSGINKNIDLLRLTEKKFQLLHNKSLVLFVDNIQQNKLNHIFLTRKDKDVFTVVIADQGDIGYQPSGLKLITLNKGICYEIYNKKKLHEYFCISNFFKYQVCIDSNIEILHIKNEINYMSICQLWNSLSYEARIEFHWRLTLLISVIIMPIIATLLFMAVSANYFLFVMFMMFFCITFFLFHILLRFYAFLEITNPIIWMWGINIVYFIIAGILNLWNINYIRKLLCKVKHYFYLNI